MNEENKDSPDNTPDFNTDNQGTSARIVENPSASGSEESRRPSETEKRYPQLLSILRSEPIWNTEASPGEDGLGRPSIEAKPLSKQQVASKQPLELKRTPLLIDLTSSTESETGESSKPSSNAPLSSTVTIDQKIRIKIEPTLSPPHVSTGLSMPTFEQLEAEAAHSEEKNKAVLSITETFASKEQKAPVSRRKRKESGSLPDDYQKGEINTFQPTQKPTETTLSKRQVFRKEERKPLKAKSRLKQQVATYQPPQKRTSLSAADFSSGPEHRETKVISKQSTNTLSSIVTTDPNNELTFLGPSHNFPGISMPTFNQIVSEARSGKKDEAFLSPTPAASTRVSPRKRKESCSFPDDSQKEEVFSQPIPKKLFSPEKMPPSKEQQNTECDRRQLELQSISVEEILNAAFKVNRTENENPEIVAEETQVFDMGTMFDGLEQAVSEKDKRLSPVKATSSIKEQVTDEYPGRQSGNLALSPKPKTEDVSAFWDVETKKTELESASAITLQQSSVSSQELSLANNPAGPSEVTSSITLHQFSVSSHEFSLENHPSAGSSEGTSSITLQQPDISFRESSLGNHPFSRIFIERNNQFICAACSAGFQTEEEWLTHERTHFDD